MECVEIMFCAAWHQSCQTYDSCQSVHFCVLITTVVILLGDDGTIRGWSKHKLRGVRFKGSLWEPEVLKVHEFFSEPLSVEGKYAVKLSITELIKISRK